ncbi:hypothetical protein LJC04_03545 [Ruminococcaceae bacterium OttesenSCG-928-O06]|nr:hypothetical protein [Ruminococcaceae bacterium OttesenSCG-928-O06]
MAMMSILGIYAVFYVVIALVALCLVLGLVAGVLLLMVSRRVAKRGSPAASRAPAAFPVAGWLAIAGGVGGSVAFALAWFSNEEGYRFAFNMLFFLLAAAPLLCAAAGLVLLVLCARLGRYTPEAAALRGLRATGFVFGVLGLVCGGGFALFLAFLRFLGFAA